MFLHRFNTRHVSFFLAAFALLGAIEAQAVQRTHVSAAFGADSNAASNCTAAAPCRFFTAAMTVTDPNGEVIVLDSGGYGGVTITQSVALIAPTGVYAGISVFPGADGVTIATAGVNVVLRGLSINGQGGSNGINMTAGNRLTVENCLISNLGQNGIRVTAAATVRVTDSIVRDNGLNGILLLNGVKATITRAVVSGNVNFGIFLFGSTPSTSTVDIADSTIDGNAYGIYARSTLSTAILKLSVRDSRIVGNTNSGLIAQSTNGAAASLTASNNMVSNNSTGLAASGAGAIVISSGNTVTGNINAGFYNVNAVFESAGNNTVRDNAGNVGTITVIATQ